MHLHCTMHVHSEHVRVITLYTTYALYFLHTWCLSAELCAPPLHTGLFKWSFWLTWGPLTITARAPFAPTRNCCAQKGLQTAIFVQSTTLMGQNVCFRDTLLCRKIGDCRNVLAKKSAKPATYRSFSDEPKHARTATATVSLYC